MLDQLDSIEKDALASLQGIDEQSALDAWRIEHLGRKSPLMTILGDLGQLSKEERPLLGKRGNEVKRGFEVALEAKAEAIRYAEMERSLKENALDVTLPGRLRPHGRLHPSTQALREFYRIWAEMGFQVYRSREVETDAYNFQLLNIPPYHPARDMQDTFYTATPGVLLRTQTSPGQIRAMREYCPEPIRVIVPGMCYRYEQASVRYDIQFLQVEGLAVGKNVRMSDLLGTLTEFARRMYGSERTMRFPASYFPFTEPSIDIAIDCMFCGRAGCPMCKYSGWLEIGGAGMVHPIVLKNGGYDPNAYSGFAFGMGPQRAMMLKHGINDIRCFWQNDLRFLEQF